MTRRQSGTASLLVLALTLGWAAGVAAQPAVLRGLVVEASSGEPLVSVNVVIEDEAGSWKGTSSNTDGYFLIANITPGVYVLSASFVSYETLRRHIRVWRRREHHRQTRTQAIDARAGSSYRYCRGNRTRK